MTSFFEKNLEAYGRRYPDSAKFMAGLDLPGYHIMKSATGDPVLVVQKQDGGWVNIDHPENPRAEATGCIHEFEGDTHLFVVFGIGLGYLLQESLKKYPASRFIVLEHDPRIFKTAFTTFDFTGILENPNVEFIVGVKIDFLENYFHLCFSKNKNDEYLAALQAILNPRVVKHSKKYYEAASGVLKRSVGNFFNMYVGNSVRDSMIGMRYALKNSACLNRMFLAESLSGKFKGMPGIVVSSGPSLTDRLDGLRKIQDRAIIICADSALKKLIQNGIVPFGVSCIERDDENAEYFKGFDIPKKTILFAPLLIKPDTFRDYPGPVGLAYRNCFPHSWLPHIMEARFTGMSCSHLSYQLLIDFGCDPIGLTGQDLAYDRESGHSHFDGVLDFAEKQYARQERYLVDDNAGGEIPTSSDWKLFCDMFENMALTNASERKSLNVIERHRGAKIKNFDRVEPEEFFAGLCERSKKIPEIDANSLMCAFREKREYFMTELKNRRVVSSREIGHFRDEFLSLASLATHAEFVRERDKISGQLSEDSRYLVDMLLRPDMKRFDSCAQTLWDEIQFSQTLPNLVEHCHSCLNELVQVLEER